MNPEFWNIFSMSSRGFSGRIPVGIVPSPIGNLTLSEDLIRDEKQNLRFPCIQWKRKRNFVSISTVYKGNANFVFRPWI
jgi:hypothetical protein